LAARTKIADENEKYNVEQIVSLKPDLILSWGGETKQIDPQLSKLGLHVVDFPVSDFSQTLQQIIQVGRLTGTQQTATTLVNQLERQVDQIKAAIAGTFAPRTLLEVDDTTPGKLYVFGGSSFGDDLAQDAHAQNIFHSDTSNSGYPQITYEAVLHADPQFIILTEDPQYGGKPAVVYARSNWQDVSAVKAHHVYHINVELMQRPGPRLVQGLRCLAQIVHPDKFTGALPAYCA
jgi:iron complex transport system substrate-binding protein